MPHVPTFWVLGTNDPMIIPIGIDRQQTEDQHPGDREPARRAVGP